MNVLRTNSSFRNLFLGKILSVFADSIIFFSLLKWIEIQSTNTGAYTLFFIANYLPVFLLALPIGAWIANKTLKKVMTYSSVIRVIVIVLFLLLIPYLTYQWAYVLLIMWSILGLFFIPANQSLLPQIVADEHRPSANSLLQLGFTLVKIIGQVFTASMIKLSISPTSLLTVSCGLIILSILFIVQIKPVVKQVSIRKQNQWTLMKEGISYVTNHLQLRPLFVILAIAMFIATSVDLILINFLTEVLGVGVENLSYIGTASLLGIIVGASLVPKWYKIIERKWLIVPPLFFLAFSIGCLFFITNWLYILPVFFLQGIALGCFNVTFVTYLQDIVAKENYTRTFSLYHMISSSMALPGILLVGGLLSSIGVISIILYIAGTLLLLGILAIFFIPNLGKGEHSSALVKQTAT